MLSNIVYDTHTLFLEDQKLKILILKKRGR
jgi:hypothetical protein